MFFESEQFLHIDHKDMSEMQSDGKYSSLKKKKNDTRSESSLNHSAPFRIFSFWQTDEVHAKDNTRPGANSPGKAKASTKCSERFRKQIVLYH